MIINLTKLLTNISNEIIIDDEIEIDKSYLENTDIKDIGKVKINGKIKPSETNYELSLNIKCTLNFTHIDKYDICDKIIFKGDIYEFRILFK